MAIGFRPHRVEQRQEIRFDGKAPGSIGLRAFYLAWLTPVVRARDVDDSMVDVGPVQHPELSVAGVRVDRQGDGSAPAERHPLA
jgi:hypothetical protein